MDSQNIAKVGSIFIHAHVCPSCGFASRRDEPGGTPDASGIFHCPKCGHQGPLKDEIVIEDDPRFRR
jgi:predicted RNA-binding Zn-ribbon protein involved in translation (DUF1610 family)